MFDSVQRVDTSPCGVWRCHGARFCPIGREAYRVDGSESEPMTRRTLLNTCWGADDETGHVLWRLRNGELPRKQLPHVVVLLVGGRDLQLAQEAGGDNAIVEAAGGIASR